MPDRTPLHTMTGSIHQISGIVNGCLCAVLLIPPGFLAVLDVGTTALQPTRRCLSSTSPPRRRKSVYRRTHGRQMISLPVVMLDVVQEVAHASSMDTTQKVVRSSSVANGRHIAKPSRLIPLNVLLTGTCNILHFVASGLHPPVLCAFHTLKESRNAVSIF